MFPFTEVLYLIWQKTMELLLHPLTNPFYIVVIVIIAFQYRRLAKMKEYLFDLKGEPYLRYALQAVIFGLIGGLAGSFIMILTGISVTGVGLDYIWPLALMLMLISPHLLCFAYAGGILSLSYLIFGWPVVNVPQIMGLVAILHLVESLLILLSGHMGAIPVYARNAAGRIVGGFTLQRFWPIPIVLIFLQGNPIMSMPHWWPLINFSPGDLHVNYLPPLIAVVAGLGYGDITLTKSPREKGKTSALYLSIYSFILLFLALAAASLPLLSYLAALFAPLGHEAIIRKGRNSELAGVPIYIPPAEGIMILDVQEGSPASKTGLKPRDIIIRLNGEPVNDRFDLERILAAGAPLVQIDFLQADSMRRLRRVLRFNHDLGLGVITVPDGYEHSYVEIRSQSMLTRLFKSLIKGKGAG